MLVDPDFPVPASFTTRRVVLRPLTVHDVVRDYDAVMSSHDHLRATQPFGPDHGWPSEALTLEQNLVDLGWHQKEFQNRSSFAYTVTTPDGARCLGCVYIGPSRRAGHDAQVILWVRAEEATTGLDIHLYEAVRSWIATDWPFASPAYPGREISWSDWNALPGREAR